MPSIDSSTGPPSSPETATSSSVIAEAIQSASRWVTRPERAVTRPPPPRRTVRCPSSSRSNWSGPRFETMISGEELTPKRLRGTDYGVPLAVDVVDQLQPVAQQARRQEHAAGVLLALAAELLAELRGAEDVQAALGALVRRVDEEAADAVLDLQRNAADVAGDRRPPLPERLGDGQPEALADRLLQADVRLRLEGVDLDRADVVEVAEDFDVLVTARVFEGLLEVLHPLGVVGGHRADHCQLRLGDLLGHLAVGVDHADRILPGVEAGDLGDQRPVDVDPELAADEGRVLGREGHVLRRERVDCRRHDPHVLAVGAHPVRDVVVEVPDAR